MGYKIGVPSLKLNNAGNKSKHCGSFGGVTHEALEERQGLDHDINPELTQYNVYTGYRSAAELMEYSDRHLKELRDASGRGIRKDAVVMCATIFKPPALYMETLPVEKQQCFFGDCLEFLGDVVGKENIKSTALHFDEQGAHLHTFWEPMTEDGRLCAKEIHNIKFFSYINEHLPAYLRARGWEIDDADCYDRAQREREEQEAQEEHYQKRKQQGRSSAAYKLDAEKQKQEVLQEVDSLRGERSKLLAEKSRLQMENADLEDEGKHLRNENAALRSEMESLQSSVRGLRDSYATTIQDKEQYNAEIDRLRGPQSPLKAFYSAVQRFVRVVANRTSTRQQITEAALGMLAPFPPLYQALANALGYENKTNMPEQERKAPPIIDDVEAIITGATQEAAAAGRRPKRQKEQEGPEL